MTIKMGAGNPEKTYHSDPVRNESITYRRLFTDASAIYAELVKGHGMNTTVLLSCKKYSNWVPSLLACWMAGAVPAIVAPGAAGETYLQTLNDYGLTRFLCDFTNDNADLAGRTIQVPAAGNAPLIESFEVNPDKIALMLFSSGTTGKQKCIPLSFNNLTDNIEQFSGRLGLSDKTVFLCGSPLYHAHGLYNSFLTAFFLGASVIYSGQLNMLNIHALFSHVHSNASLTFHITPSMIPIMLEYISRNSLKSMPDFENMICGTAFLDSGSKEKLESQCNAKIYQQYGMTETLFMAINDSFSDTKPLSVGKPLSGVELEICDGDMVLPAGLPGAIRVKTKSCFGSYFYAEAGDTSFRDGYFYTGDIGYLDKEHCLFITGREKDLIKKGGLSISGNFISSIIKEVPGVLDAYTLGVKDAMLGEEIYSFFLSDTDISEDNIYRILRKKIALNLMPKKIFRVDAFPGTATGKIKRAEMELMLKERLNG